MHRAGDYAQRAIGAEDLRHIVERQRGDGRADSAAEGYRSAPTDLIADDAEQQIPVVCVKKTGIKSPQLRCAPILFTGLSAARLGMKIHKEKFDGG